MKKHLLVALSVLCLCSCFEEKKVENDKEDIVAKQETKSTPDKNDKYVYIDDYRCLHLDKDCHAFLTEQDHLDEPLYSIRYYAKKDLESSSFHSYCRKCTDIEDYEYIKKIVRVNDNRKKVYDALDKHYDMPSYEKFYNMLDDEEGRKKAYNRLKDEGYTGIGDTYAEFVDFISHEGKYDK